MLRDKIINRLASMKNTAFFFGLLFFFFFARESLSAPLWGAPGHQLTASIAEFFLDSYSMADTSSILNSTQIGLSPIAAWADGVRNTYPWSSPLHFTNIQDWSCAYVNSDCPAKEGCVVSAIYNYTYRLKANDPFRRQEALKFLVHFYGDLHQPLHCGFVSDKGGNSITGNYFGKSTNLHSIWDSKLISTRISRDFNNSQDVYIAYLVSKIRGEWSNIKDEWISCPNNVYPCPEVWANQSAHLTCSNVYIYPNGTKIENGFDLGEDYYQMNADTIDLQLARGGYRLATGLNKALFPEQPDNEVRWWLLMLFFILGLIFGLIATLVVIFVAIGLRSKISGRYSDGYGVNAEGESDLFIELSPESQTRKYSK